MVTINDEEWNNMQTLPEPGQECKVLIIKDIKYIKKMDENSFEWKEDKEGEHRFFAWKPITERATDD